MPPTEDIDDGYWKSLLEEGPDVEEEVEIEAYEAHRRSEADLEEQRAVQKQEDGNA